MVDEEALLTETMTLLSEYSVLSAQYQIAFETFRAQYINDPRNPDIKKNVVFATFPNKVWASKGSK